jgi:DNA-binding IclR family transcriptional regulator
VSHKPIVRTVEKAVLILKAFSLEEPELGVNEISRRLGFHKSSVSRILATLEQGGLVERSAHSDNYRLGLGILLLASKTFTHLDLRQAASDVIHSLADACQETVTLSVLQNDQIVDLEVALSRYSLRSVAWVGKNLPLHCTSAGKLMLAFASEEDVNRVLKAPLFRHTEHTITDPQVLRSELVEIRHTGIAMALGELEPGLNALAVPIYDSRGHATAALERLKELAGPAQEAALNISRRLGCLA